MTKYKIMILQIITINFSLMGFSTRRPLNRNEAFRKLEETNHIHHDGEGRRKCAAS